MPVQTLPRATHPFHFESTPFSAVLSGQNAFYRSPTYLQSTQADLRATSVLPATYTWDTESKIIRIAKLILSIVLFPLAIYRFLHALAGKIALLPASNPRLMGYLENHANQSRSSIQLGTDWKYKRITVEVDGYKIDAMIVGKEPYLGNGRWVLASNGNGEFYEDKLSFNEGFKQFLTQINGNAIVFNYPGVGASSGLPNRHAMAKAYRALLTFLEDRRKGIGAREIIGYGHSIGAGVQGDALNDHPLKRNIQYAFIKSRTFSDLTTTASSLTNPFLGFLVRILGWNMNPAESSKKLQAPEIILQTANVPNQEELVNSSQIVDDGIIPAHASLAKVLLDDPECPKNNKTFFGVRERHNERLNDPSFLARRIEAYLNR